MRGQRKDCLELAIKSTHGLPDEVRQAVLNRACDDARREDVVEQGEIEDRHYTARPSLAEVLATLTNSALTALRACCPPDNPLRALADYIQWSPARGLKLLGLK